ncbi:TonB-dependent receptor [Bacteroidia bacterium]|nr:TonB-dependent receptor [Bacteroidia bacterium]
MKHILSILLLAGACIEVSAQKEVDLAFQADSVVLEEVIVTSQQREQRILDIPITLSTLSAKMLENTATRNLEQLSALVPGLNIRIQTPHRPTFVIRGVTSDEVNLTDQPRVSVYYNQVPTSRSSMAITELYDLERVEVLKGPQGTLFGRGAYLGVLNFITQKPKADFGGYVSAGLGNYNMREVQGAINVPILKNKLLVRAAGIYSYQDGYVKNLSGGDNLNGKNTFGGRFSATYRPIEDLKIDLLVNYQKDDNPGTAFMSKLYPNSKGEKDIFKYEASLDPGQTWFNKRDVLLSSLNIKYDITENSYLTSITSLVNNKVDHHYDGDGTVAPALDMTEFYDMQQFTQELRYNFSLNDELSGLFGTGYWRESGDYSWGFDPNEKYAVFPVWNIVKGYFPDWTSSIYPQLYGTPLIAANGKANYLDFLPGSFSGSATDVPLPSDHHEQINNGAISQAFDFFADATYQIIDNLSITAGLRATYESFEAKRNVSNNGIPSALGVLMQMSPNLFSAPIDFPDISNAAWAVTYRAGLKYDFSPQSNVYFTYSRGHRPAVLQYNNDATTANPAKKEVLNAEGVHSLDAGFKWTAQNRYWFDAGVFFQKYNDFQTARLDNTTMGYVTDDAGKATSYGAEVTAKAALSSYLDVFGNYAYIHARFDDTDADGNPQQYAGKTFRLTPEHSFDIGFTAKYNFNSDVQLLFTPAYSWKSHVWFEDSNDRQMPGLDQDAYGLLNANLALHLAKYGLTISAFGSNLTGTKYVIGAGNTGLIFGVPTFVPGAPRMFGGQVKYNF